MTTWGAKPINSNAWTVIGRVKNPKVKQQNIICLIDESYRQWFASQQTIDPVVLYHNDFASLVTVLTKQTATKNSFLCSFADICTYAEAVVWKQAEIWTLKKYIPALKYIDYTVIYNNKLLGKVTNSFFNKKYVVIELIINNKPSWVPLVDAYTRKIDQKTKTIVLRQLTWEDSDD